MGSEALGVNDLPDPAEDGEEGRARRGTGVNSGLIWLRSEVNLYMFDLVMSRCLGDI